jgi:hypothetical protein
MAVTMRTSDIAMTDYYLKIGSTEVLSEQRSGSIQS